MSEKFVIYIFLFSGVNFGGSVQKAMFPAMVLVAKEVRAVFWNLSIKSNAHANPVVPSEMIVATKNFQQGMLNLKQVGLCSSIFSVY